MGLVEKTVVHSTLHTGKAIGFNLCDQTAGRLIRKHQDAKWIF